MGHHMSHFIKGKWNAGSGSKFSSINPATGMQEWEGTAATIDEVNSAIESAKKAFGEWAFKDISSRIYYLHAFRETLSHSRDLLAEAISRETGKPLWESKNEVAAMVNKIAIAIEAYSVRCPEIHKEQAHGQSITRHRPHGVLAVFGPYNFPGHLPNGHIVPALLAGNTIIFKPSELTPHVAEIMVDCWNASGLPAGAINLLQGGKDTGALIAQHPGIDGLLFTGSWQTGHQLAEQFAKYPYKILALEMGGNNPLVISEVYDLKTCAYLTIQSAFLTSGQRCTCARRLIIPQGKLGDDFLDVFKEMVKTLRIGSYNDVPEPFMGPVVSRHAAEKIMQKQDHMLAHGATALLKSERLKLGGAFISPGIIDVTKMSQREDEEIFGPLLQVIRVKDFDAAIEEANQTQYGLVAGLFSNNEDEYRRFFNQVRAGVINWNMQLTGASSAAPFGGIGHSGNNRPSAFYAADYCAYPVASLEASALKMPSNITPGIKI